MLGRTQRQSFLTKSHALPSALFAGLIAAYAALLVVALASDSLLLSIPAAVLSGLAIGLLFILGHDACHQSLTPTPWLNQLIGRIAFLPSLHPYSLWDLGHNRTHHRFNNVRGHDYVWEPMSPADYRQAGPVQRASYRLLRSPIGLFAYYGIKVWAKRMFFVLPWKTADGRPAYAVDLLIVWLFLAVQLWVVVTLGGAFGHRASHSLLFGFAIPFLVWNALMSFVIYLHHTHPAVPWYESVDAWRAAGGRISGTAHVRFPPAIDTLLLHIMQHNAHHYAPGVPLYNLVPLQKLLEPHGGASWRWSPRQFLQICRHCKLFDYDAGSWRGFPTS